MKWIKKEIAVTIHIQKLVKYLGKGNVYVEIVSRVLSMEFTLLLVKKTLCGGNSKKNQNTKMCASLGAILKHRNVKIIRIVKQSL